jgi:hypothetical protein
VNAHFNAITMGTLKTEELTTAFRDIAKAAGSDCVIEKAAEWLNAALRRGDSIWFVTDPAAYSQYLMTRFQTTGGSRYISLELGILDNFGSLTPATSLDGQASFFLFTP